MDRYDDARIESELRTRPLWRLDHGSLFRVITFPGFSSAMSFVARVGEVAETLGHHPDIAIHYNRLELRLRTHSEGAITHRDFQLADAIDSLDETTAR